MRSDREAAMRREPINDAQEHALLKALREIDERHVTAENKVEEQGGRFAPHVLMQEFNALSTLRLDAADGAGSLESFVKEVRRQFAQTRWLKASSAGATKHGFIDVSRQD